MLKMISRLLVLSSILLAACSVLLPQPTATPAPTVTPLPTGTSTPTLTPLPMATATVAFTVTPTQDLAADLVPKGTPEKEWNGFPIMPGALAGSGDAGSYRFTVKATVAEIKSFYDKELTAAGWVALTVGSSKTGASMLIFTKDAQTFTVSIIPFKDLFIVMFVQ